MGPPSPIPLRSRLAAEPGSSCAIANLGATNASTRTLTGVGWDSGPLQLVVDPPQQHRLGRQLHQVLHLLPGHQQVGQAGALVQADLVEQAYPDDLPQEAQDQVLLALDQVVGVDVDHVAADGLGRVEGEGQVLHLGVHAGTGLLVDRALVYRVGARVVDDFTEIKICYMYLT